MYTTVTYRPKPQKGKYVRVENRPTFSLSVPVATPPSVAREREMARTLQSDDGTLNATGRIDRDVQNTYSNEVVY